MNNRRCVYQTGSEDTLQSPPEDVDFDDSMLLAGLDYESNSEGEDALLTGSYFNLLS